MSRGVKLDMLRDVQAFEEVSRHLKRCPDMSCGSKFTGTSVVLLPTCIQITVKSVFLKMYYFKIPSELLHYMYFIPLQSGQEQKEVINSDSKVNFKPGVLIPVDASILL